MLIMAFLVVSSCGKSFLELEPQQSFGLDVSIVDFKTLNAATLGVYSNFQSENAYGWDFNVIGDLRSDNTYISSKNAGRFLVFDDYALTDQSGRPRNEWLEMYQNIVNASNIINKFADVELLSSEEEDGQDLLGQAHGLRALSYWNLVRLFAKPYSADGGASLGVPITNEGTTGTLVSPSRATVAEVYNQIISDLTMATSKISTTETGRFSKAAAHGLLAKVYLYQEDWSNAVTVANTAIGEAGYSLYGSGDEWLSSWGANAGSEDLFTLVNLPTDNLGVNSVGGIYDQNGYGDILATDDLYGIYSETDARRDVMSRGDRADGEVNAVFAEGKYPRGETGQDYLKIIRLADVYLVRAEAKARMGDEAGAIADLTAVASRVDPNYAETTATGDDLIAEILTERRKELAFEGDRIYDLTRTKSTWTKFRTFDDLTVSWDNDLVINPIPLDEMNVNPNMVQNSGY